MNIPTHTDTAAYSLVGDRLARVERELERLLQSDIGMVREIARYMHANGGKRLRPALVLLVARLFDYRGKRDVDLGVIVEFIHSATLVHDDIIDGATVRRGKQSVNEAWGNQLAVLQGDFLYARSLAMSVALGNLRLVEVLTDATSRLVEGEILDVIHNGDAGLDRERYAEIIDRKTASLFAGCTRAAAVLAGASAADEEAVARYGHDLGLAFQLVDDLLDYTADARRLGKEPGTDLREGKVTLPLIHLIESASFETRELALECLGSAEATQQRLGEVVDAMERTGSLAAARAAAEERAVSAREALSHLPSGEVRDALAALPEYIIARQH